MSRSCLRRPLSIVDSLAFLLLTEFKKCPISCWADGGRSFVKWQASSVVKAVARSDGSRVNAFYNCSTHPPIHRSLASPDGRLLHPRVRYGQVKRLSSGIGSESISSAHRSMSRQNNKKERNFSRPIFPQYAFQKTLQMLLYYRQNSRLKKN